jgi:hypothetical protein
VVDRDGKSVFGEGKNQGPTNPLRAAGHQCRSRDRWNRGASGQIRLTSGHDAPFALSAPASSRA